MAIFSEIPPSEQFVKWGSVFCFLCRLFSFVTLFFWNILKDQIVSFLYEDYYSSKKNDAARLCGLMPTASQLLKKTLLFFYLANSASNPYSFLSLFLCLLYYHCCLFFFFNEWNGICLLFSCFSFISCSGLLRKKEKKTMHFLRLCVGLDC